MKIQTIKNKIYKQFDMKPDMVGRIFISSAIDEAYLTGKLEVLNELNFEDISQRNIEKEIKALTPNLENQKVVKKE